ncbi:hypothetical protein AVEN_206604-1 [Araneus ventricosus]|uniref:Uncharacterized protein n=1 Tax=Araneus ventricosus TaxID=182803 RepID=A0A4Y2V7J9_ARAVE|nr:hypothetical protein AVEN_206604-1 [Araneus ventricosus]
MASAPLNSIKSNLSESIHLTSKSREKCNVMLSPPISGQGRKVSSRFKADSTESPVCGARTKSYVVTIQPLVWRGSLDEGVPAQVSSSSSAWFQNYEVCPKIATRVASKRDF